MAKELKDWLDEFVEQGANPKNVPDWPENGGVLTIEITSEDITIEGNTIVFNSDVAQEIMSMNKRIRVDASITDPTLEQGKFIAVFTPRGITDYSLLQPNTIVYEYSTTNWLLDTYRTTYVEFVWNETTEKLYVDKNTPAHYEDHIVGFDTSFNDGNIRLTSNIDMRKSSINALHINNFNIISTNTDVPSLEFNANSNNELESVVFREDGSSVDFTYTIPKGAKHYVVNELPTTDIDTNGNYYVMTESEDAREYLPTDIHNLTTTEYPPSTTGTLRQDATVNSSDWVKLNATTISSGDYMGDIAIKFNIPCEVTLSVNPRQTRLAFMYIDVNGVNVKLVNAGETYTYTRVFGVDETLCVRGASFSTNDFYYKLAIQPHTIDGKIPLSTNVDEYINFENMWFKNGGGGGTTVVANPTLAGTEPDLTGLEVDGAKYKVPQGGGSGGIEFVQIDGDATSINQETLEKLVDFNNNSLKPNFIVLTIDGSYDTPILMPSDNLAYVYRSAVMNGSYYQLTLSINEEGADIDIEQVPAVSKKYLHRCTLQLYRDITAQGVVYNDAFVDAEFFIVSSRDQMYNTFKELLSDVLDDGSNIIMQQDTAGSNGKHWNVTYMQKLNRKLTLTIIEETFVSVVDSSTQKTYSVLSALDSSVTLDVTELTGSDRLIAHTPIAL